ncbi:hypothetical protein [Gracilimonas tropica]|uniref:hypothetical protein n=1 Tax=Gracilimonas tropica TaxID=454600 RepID=UPI00038188F9|nr:hypothetical protein [Gracilimonas tropica]
MAEQVRIKVIIDSSDAKKGSKESKEYLLDIKEAADKTERSTKELGTGTVTAGNLMAMAYAEVAQRAMQITRQTRDLAFAVEETGSKYKTVLGPNLEQANQFLEENAGLLGVTTREGQDYLATSTQIAEGLGMQRDAAAEFGMEWAKMAGDFQSFFNTDYDQAFNAIRSGLVGETEPLKQFGVVIREAEVAERALAETGKERAEDLEEHERVQARYNMIMEQAGRVVGDLERTQQSGANQTRRMEAAYREIADQLASRTLPLWGDFARTGLDVADAITDILGLNYSDELMKERTELNGLVIQLSNAGDGTERRRDLIEEINDKYPGFLKNLDDEKISNEELTERLREANEAYREKIALQIADEEVKRKQREAAELLFRQAQAEQKIYEEATDLLREHGKEIDLVGKSTEEILQITQEALADQAKYTQDSGSQFSNMPINDVAMGLSNLRGQQAELASLGARYAEIEEDVASALDVRTRAQDRLNQTNQEAISKTGGGDDQAVDQPVEVPIIARVSPESIKIAETSLKGLNSELKKATEEYNTASADEEREHWAKRIAVIKSEIAKIDDQVEIKLEAVPKVTTGSLNELHGQLREAEKNYLGAVTEFEREKWAKRKQTIEEEIAAKEAGITREQYLRREAHKEAMQQAAEYIEMIGQAYQVINGFQQASIEARIAKIEAEKDAALSAIDAKLENDRLSERSRQKLIDERAEKEEEYQNKIDALNKKQYEMERRARIFATIQETALAVMEAAPNLGKMAFIGALGAVQVATIAKQPNPYLEGGLVEERLRSGLSSPGKKLISINENDKPEFIMNAASTARSLPILNRMNQDPAYAERINRQVMQPRISAASFSGSRVAEQNINTDGLGSTIRDAVIEGMSGLLIRPIIPVTDINEAQRQRASNQRAVGNEA